MQKYFGRRLAGGVGRDLDLEKAQTLSKTHLKTPVIHQFVQRCCGNLKDLGKAKNETMRLLWHIGQTPDLT